MESSRRSSHPIFLFLFHILFDECYITQIPIPDNLYHLYHRILHIAQCLIFYRKSGPSRVITTSFRHHSRARLLRCQLFLLAHLFRGHLGEELWCVDFWSVCAVELICGILDSCGGYGRQFWCTLFLRQVRSYSSSFFSRGESFA